MADNIKIVGNILSTTTVTRYSSQDTNLISSPTNLQKYFGETGDYIEYCIHDIAKNLLNLDYSYLSYKLPTGSAQTPTVNTPPNTTGHIQMDNVGIVSTLSTSSALYPIIEIDPIVDLQNNGYSSGEFIVVYNLFKNKISNSDSRELFIQEISTDRTEVRLKSTTLSDSDIENKVLELIREIESSTYQVDYLLNFGDNKQYVAVNVALNKATDGYEVLFKLYDPLPLDIQPKTTLWVVEEKTAPYQFSINLDRIITPPPPPQLRGPNFDITIPNNGTVSTEYNTYSNLVSNLQSLQQTSYHQILNLLATQSIDINIDYTNFDNFVFFGSAYQRLSNFYTKVKQIEDYNTLINAYTPLTASRLSLITEINQYTSNINTLITQFDGYEHYLYFESSSYAWPKLESSKPFTLLSTGSSEVLDWYFALTSSAQTYDLDNYNNLEYAIPVYLKDNTNNAPFLLFLNMVGHYFDNIWIYLKSITDINLANNNLEIGISKDLVYERLKSLGLKLYNSQAGENVDQFLIGANTGSSEWDGDTSVTGNYLNNIPRKDLVSELYKRIYHNLPLLVKTKGTVSSLEYLTTIFGITGSILNAKEYGGATKNELLRGYNNNKVRVVNNSILGNVLSHELSLQPPYSSTSDFRDEDSHYIDISFSPQTQIDTYISGAIAATDPTWSLDNYIGDPRQLYNNSYSDLDTQRKLYFETGVPNFPPFTGSALEYNTFIRLIEYFDNALFKMLEDFVPERASLSTGVTINSPVLERNKAVYSNPINTTTQSVYDADYNIASINAQYGQLYDELQGDKKSFYTGELSGSTVDVGQYFEDNYNQYLGDWNVFNAQRPIKENINQNTFLHSDWNVLLNNISQSVVSNYRRKIEYIWGTTGSILSPVELQDSYLSLRSYNVSRYEGSKVTSLSYNTYTSASNTYGGDKSFGKTAAIDRNSYKFAWVKTIESRSLDFYDKTKIQLKYLIDGNSSITELNAANKNLFEVQNTFKSGKPTTVSITDIYKPSNQKKLDGIKTIFKGGFSYSPILFRENYETVTIRFDEPYSSSIAPFEVAARNNNTYYHGNDYTRTGNEFVNGFMELDQNPNDVAYFINNVRVLDQNFSYGNLPFSDWSVYYPDQNPSLGTSTTSYFNPNRKPIVSPKVYKFNNIVNFDSIIKNTENENIFSNNNSSNDSYIYKVPRNSRYNINVKVPFSFMHLSYDLGSDPVQEGEFKFIGLLQKTKTPNSETSWFLAENLIASSSLQQIPGFNSNIGGVVYNNNGAIKTFGGKYAFTYGDFLINTNLTDIILNEGEYIRYVVCLIDTFGVFSGAALLSRNIRIGFNLKNVANGSGRYTLDINDRASISIQDIATQKETFFYDKEYRREYPLFTTGSSNQLIFDGQITEWFTTSSMFIPSLPTSNLYSEVTEPISIEQGDLIRLSEFNKPKDAYYEVIKSEIITSPLQPAVQILGSFKYRQEFDPSNPRFLFFSFVFSYNPNTYPIEFKQGDTFTVSNTNNNNNTFTVKEIINVPEIISGTSIDTKVLILVSGILFGPLLGVYKEETLVSPATFTFIGGFIDKLHVTLNSPINLIKYKGDESFAIFKSKPDETSVIVEHKKKDGEVAQTLLIPEDISTKVKDKIGDIVKNINVDLS